MLRLHYVHGNHDFATVDETGWPLHNVGERGRQT